MKARSMVRRGGSRWLWAVVLTTVSALGVSAQELQINGQIATSSRTGPEGVGTFEIYLMNPDGTGRVAVTSNSTEESYPRWSPDGGKIAFATTRDGNSEIYAMNADGTSQVRLINHSASDFLGAWSPDGGKIAFASDRDGDRDIFVMNADGTGVTQIVNSPGYDEFPDWSPDGTKIAFYSERDGNGEIYVMNSDGTGQTRLTTASAQDTQPAWSPDGTKIVFISARNSGNNEIYVMNADGTGQTRLTTDLTSWEGAPSWSADGTKIVYGKDSSGGRFAYDNYEIYSINPDGTGEVRLTNNSVTDNSPAWTPFRRVGVASTGSTVSRIMSIKNTGTATLSVTDIASDNGQFTISPTSFGLAPGSSQNVTVTLAPTSAGAKYGTLTISSNDVNTPTAKLTVNGTGLAPDLQIGGRITFMTNRDGNYEIYTMNPDGSSLTRLTTNPAEDGQPFWSPDGTKIAFESFRDGDREVYMMNADGTGQTRLTNNSALDGGPVWSSDGTRIAFTSDRNGDREVYVMNIDGTGQTRLTNASGQDGATSWSPDGTKIGFSSERDGNHEVYVMNVDGTGQTRLTNNAAIDQNPVWSPDGTRIAFLSTRDGNHEIYVMNADGTGQTRLTNNSAVDVRPFWSPDGTKLVFYSERDDNGEIYRMNADGSAVSRLTNNPASDHGCNWAAFKVIASTSVGTSVSRTIAIENKGLATLVVSSILSADGHFSASPNSFSVAPGGSQNVSVTFSPTSAGAQYSTLSISSNDPENPVASLIVNGTGQPVSVSVPDTTATYGQALSLPVRVLDLAGAGLVSFEVGLVYDGALLLSPTVQSTGTLSAGWSLQSNIIEGPGTLDTLRVAAATDVAGLTGPGTLFKVNFTTADVRHPAASPANLVQVLLNTSSSGIVLDHGSVTWVGVNGTLSSAPAIIIPRWPVTVTMSDADENRNNGVAESRSAAVSNGTQTETLTLTETGLSTGVFTGAINTVFSLASSSGDGVVQAKAGDLIIFSFADSLNSAGATVLRKDTTAVIGGKNGQFRATAVVQPGDTLRVRLIDGDLNTNTGLQENTVVSGTNVRTGELEVISLTESSADDSVFFGTVRTAAGSGAGVNNDGVVNAQKTDSLVITYADTLTSLGGTANVGYTDRVVSPFGDADGNGSVQAFDAARVLFHVLSPFIVGIDSLSANVDLLAPFGPISPFDASLILQKRVGLIGRFPVQEDEADNHPQPQTDNSTPKKAIAQRVLSLQRTGEYWSVVIDEREGVLAGELWLEGVEGRVEMAPELGEYLVAARQSGEELRIAFAGARSVAGPGELVRVYAGVGPGTPQLARTWLNDGQFEVRSGAAEPAQQVPQEYALYRNWPNPFNPETTIGFALPQPSQVELTIYDALGQKVRTLAMGLIPAGTHQVRWDGRDEAGQVLGSGIYLYRLQAGEFSQIRSMLLLK